MEKVDNSLRFRWTSKKIRVAQDLAEGYTKIEASQRNQISRQAIWKWERNAAFTNEVERLTLMVGIAMKAERMIIVKLFARQQMGEEIKTRRDLLDWLKFAKSETDGLKLNLTSEYLKAIESQSERDNMP